MVRVPRTVKGMAASLIAVSVTLNLASTRAPARDEGHAGMVDASVYSGVRISGHATGLYPGRRVKMRVTLVNQRWSAVIVTRVGATVGTTVRCSSKMIRIRSFRGSIRIPARRRARITLRVWMPKSAPDACQGTRFPIGFHATLRAA